MLIGSEDSIGKGRVAEQHSSMPQPRIIVAEDHPLFRSALRLLLERSDSLMEVVAEATDGQQALELALTLKPDLVLMDVRMPKMDGLEATHAIKRELPKTVVLMMTASEEPNHLAEAIKAGAAGYVLKSATAQQIIDAIRAALDGEFPLDPKIARHLILDLMEVQSNNERPSSDVVAPESPPLAGEHSQGEEALPSSLTGREVEILRLLGQGRSNQQIAHDLFISTSTVKKHVRLIISKLGVSDRTQAVIRAIELGLRSEPNG
jgi:two-component system, NarL family, response regulator LiaR